MNACPNEMHITIKYAIYSLREQTGIEDRRKLLMSER